MRPDPIRWWRRWIDARRAGDEVLIANALWLKPGRTAAFLAEATDMRPGRVDGALRRMHADGRVQVEWSGPRYPRCRCYWLTSKGVACVAA